MLILNDGPEDKIKLAAEFHAVWSDWMDFIFRQCVQNSDGTMTIPKEFVDHWGKRMQTTFVDLPEDAKGWHRETVDKYLKILGG